MHCQTRWRRQQYPRPTWQPRDTDFVEFGQYETRTYHEVYRDKQYCEWVFWMVKRGEAMKHPGIHRLAAYIHQRESERNYVTPPMNAPPPTATAAPAAMNIS